jgi:2-amino-4-hydroxy-6-hydroxymethyldihydropteridine diphosphokinase
MHKDRIVFISAGSNIGDRVKFLSDAIETIKLIEATQLIKISDFFETKALEVTDQPDFINIIIKISTKQAPLKLLEALQEIEVNIGRNRRFDKGPREIDLDILIFEGFESSTEKLTIPHHSLFSRPFIKDILFSMSEGDIFNYYSGRYKNANNYSVLSN